MKNFLLVFVSVLFISNSFAQSFPRGGYSGQVVERTTGKNVGWTVRQDSLENTVNIKSVNGTTLLGAGDLAVGTVTSIDGDAGTGISLAGLPITATGTFTVTNTAPDQTVVLNNGTGISNTGTYPTFTVTNTAPDQTVTIDAGTDISIGGAYPTFTVTNTAVNENLATADLVQGATNRSYTMSGTQNLSFQNSGTGIILLNSDYDITGDGGIIGSTNLGGTVFFNNSTLTLPSAKFQGSLGIWAMGTQTVDNSAVLAINSTTRGFLPPRMTTAEKNAITTPTTGLMVFDTDLTAMALYNGATWVGFADGNGIYDGSGTVPTSVVATLTDNLFFENSTAGFHSIVLRDNSSADRVSLYANSTTGQLVLNGTTGDILFNTAGDCYINGQQFGIGHTAPDHLLHIEGTGTTDGLRVENSGGAGGDFFAIPVGAGTGDIGVYAYAPSNRGFQLDTRLAVANYFNIGNVSFGTTSNLGATVGVQGPGATAGTTHFLGTNSASAKSLELLDDTHALFGGFTNTTTQVGIKHDSGVDDALHIADGSGTYMNISGGYTAGGRLDLKVAGSNKVRISSLATENSFLGVGPSNKVIIGATTEATGVCKLNIVYDDNFQDAMQIKYIGSNVLHKWGQDGANNGFYDILSGGNAVIKLTAKPTSHSYFNTGGGTMFGTNSDLGYKLGVTGGLGLVSSDFTMETAGDHISIASGSNERAGNATLVAGTVTVANTSVTANTLVLLTKKTDGGTIGTITYTTSAATSFTITSDSGSDTSTYTYLLIENP